MESAVGEAGDDTSRQIEPYWRGWQGWNVFFSRLVHCVVLWLVLAAGEPESWVVGVPAVLAAAVLSACTLPSLRWSPAGTLRFWRFFLMESLRGGWDVARRAFHWRLPLSPGVVEHRSRTSVPLVRVSVANTLSLLPGTLTADLDDRNLYVHALDAGEEVAQSLVEAEEQVADLFGVVLEIPEQDRGPE